MTRLRVLAVAVMAAVALAAPSGGAGAEPSGDDAAPGPVPVFAREPDVAGGGPGVDAGMVVRSESLRALPGGLAALGRPGTESVVAFELFGDVTVVASGSPRDFRAKDAFTWSGRAVDGYGEVLLVVTAGRVTGTVVTEQGEFEIRPGGGRGLHTVSQVDRSAFTVQDDSVRVPAELLGAPAPRTAERATRVGTEVDVLVVYTDAARASAGGVADMEDLIRFMVAWTNEAYDNSGIGHDMRLVHMAEVVYDEHPGDSGTDLLNLRCPDGGYNCPNTTLLDEVHGWRDTYGADLVVLIADVDDVCGVAYTPEEINPAYEEWAFSLVNVDCRDNTFAHETGHNQGAMHDRQNGLSPGPGDYAPYAAGHIEPPHFRTVMAYYAGCPNYQCPPIKHFSNPDVSVDVAGRWFATGVPGTNPATAEDNARVLDEFAATVAAYRGGGGPPPSTGWDDYTTPLVISGLPFDGGGDTSSATAQQGEPIPSCQSSFGHSVWLAHTPGTDVEITATTFGSTYDTVLAVYEEGLGNEVACNDDSDYDADEFQSQVTFDAQAGKTYYFQVSGYADSRGVLDFHVSAGGPTPPPPTGDTCMGLPVTLDMADLPAGAVGVGTQQRDVILGTEGNDRIVAMGGDDVICGLGGDDRIQGGPGDDVIDAGPGADVVRGGPDDDVIYGGPGDDPNLNGGTGDDEVYGEAGRDQVVGWTGNDLVDGGPGDDGGGVGAVGLILGMSGIDEIHGGGGDDRIRAGVGNDTVYAGDGDDVAYGGEGADVLDGGAGRDELYGGSGNDTCTAGEVLDSC